MLGHLRRLAAGHGGSVLAAHGSELARDVPFGVARRLLDPVVRAAPEVLDDGHARTARAVFTGELRSGAGGSAMPLAQGLLSLVAGLRRPCALVVDDVQWADAGSLLMLAELAGRLAEVPVVLAVGV
ncbi:MAG: ATP-binding protein, partial [Solirubrobacteraceae bacterium]